MPRPAAADSTPSPPLSYHRAHPWAQASARELRASCFGLDVQETQNTAQKKKTGKMREEKQDTLSIIFILLCSLLGSASRVQVAVRLRCELAYDINGMRQRRGGAVRT